MAWIRRRIGATSRLAKFSPNQIAESSTISAISANIEAKAIWMPWRRLSIARYSTAAARAIVGNSTASGFTSRATKRYAPSYCGSLQHRSEHPAFARHDADRIGRVLRLVEGFLGQGGRILQHVDIRPGHGFVRRLDDPHHRQAERGRPRGDELVEPAPIDIEDRPGSREVVGEDADFARQALALARRVGVGDLDGVEDDVAHLLGEPGLEAPLQGHRCDERDEDRRQGGDEAEQADDPHVQPRRRRPGEPRPDEALGLPRHHADEKQDEEAVQPEDRQDDLVRRDDRGRAGEDEKRRERRPQRRDDRQRADPARAAGLRLEDAGVLAAALVDLVQTTPPIGSQEGFGGRILVAVA